MAATTKTKKKPETEEQRRARLDAAKKRRAEALAAIPPPPHPLDDLGFYDIIINSSGGKDSQAMLDYVHELLRKAGLLHRVLIVVVHVDMGKEEWDETVPLAPGWKGTVDLTGRQAAAYGLRFEVRFRRNKKTKKREGLLMQVRARGMWPSAKARYCTSDQKRAVVRAFITELVRERGLDRPARVLNIKGMRSQESCAREEMAPFEMDEGATYPSTRHVWTWLPIKEWTVEQVWQRIRASGVPYHPIYDHGVSRASCSLCVLASKCDLIKSIQLRDQAATADASVPNLVDEYIAVEEEIGHKFRADVSIAELAREARGGETVQLGLFATVAT